MRSEDRVAVAHEVALALAELGASTSDIRRAKGLVERGTVAALKAVRVVLWERGNAKLLGAEKSHVMRSKHGERIVGETTLYQLFRRVGKQVAAGVARKGVKNGRE